MHMTLAGLILATLPFTIVDKTGPDTTVRHLSGKEIDDTLQKGMTDQALYSQVLLARHDSYQIHITARDKSGQAEVHENWSDHIFIKEGQASFIIGGTVVDGKDREPGETRGTAIKGGNIVIMRTGDYLFVPPGTPHQMIVEPGRKVTFIGFRTHK